MLNISQLKNGWGGGVGNQRQKERGSGVHGTEDGRCGSPIPLYLKQSMKGLSIDRQKFMGRALSTTMAVCNITTCLTLLSFGTLQAHVSLSPCSTQFPLFTRRPLRTVIAFRALGTSLTYKIYNVLINLSHS